jgi:hypothetical protein
MNNEIKMMIQKVDRYKNIAFDEEVLRRLATSGIFPPNDDALLEHMSNLIVYSQNAKSALVTAVINSGALKKALCNFRLEEVVKLNPCDVIDNHWHEIKGIRQQTKIFQIIMLARKIYGDKSISSLLTVTKIPKVLSTKDDVNTFWQEFDTLKGHFNTLKLPFFRETTSLLHLLVSLGYDCVKPDSAVMKAAKSMNIISSESDEKNLSNAKKIQKVVATIQQYSILNGRKLPPSVLDLYFIVCGGQTDAKKYVSSEYYSN